MRYALHAAAVLVGGLSLSPLAFAAPDWTSVPATTIHVFHPGVTPWEWIESKGKHGGSRGLSRGESCAGCHVENGEINVDLERMAGELDHKGGPAVRAFPVQVQAAYDAGQLYVRMSFKAPVRPGDTVHACVTVVSIDPEKARAVLSTVCRVRDTVVIEGEATVKTTSRAGRKAV